jgi:hypothetical protein
MRRHDRRWILALVARERRRQSVQLAAVQLVHEADLQDLRSELREAKAILQRLGLIDKFARSDRDWSQPLH